MIDLDYKVYGCADCNYKNFPPDAVPCVYCDAGDQFAPIEDSEDEDVMEVK